ncbi:MAG: TIGR02147 family protein [Bacteriovoracaceae bacterium]|nr:TIGR02147 family protein [Bacteriovoracaceae bacterium]
MTENIEINDPIQWIQDEYFRRKELDTSYSTRSFSKVLGVSSGRLSELFSGKRNLTLNMGERFADALGMDPETEEKFKNSIIDQKQKKSKRSRSFNNLKKDDDKNFKRLNQDIYSLISKQQYFAILNLMKTSDFKNCSIWIGGRLDIPPATVVKSIQLMKRVGVLKEENGKLERIHKKYRTSDNIESRAIKSAHREKLQHALVSLETIPVELRDITSMTCPIKKDKLPEIKKLIKEFRRGLSQFMEEGDSDEVYNLNIQLVPLTNVKEEARFNQ